MSFERFDPKNGKHLDLRYVFGNASVGDEMSVEDLDGRGPAYSVRYNKCIVIEVQDEAPDLGGQRLKLIFNDANELRPYNHRGQPAPDICFSRP